MNADIAKQVADNNVFSVGARGFYDTFSGLVPCKVVAIKAPCYGFRSGPYDVVTIKLTADRGPYRKGEVLTTDAAHAVPAKMIRKTKYSNRIGVYYSYK